MRVFCKADGYAGFNKLYEKGRIVEAACWAHVRRKFHDLYQAHRSPIAKEALERIGQLYSIEQEIRGRSPAERKEVRQARSRPLLESMQTWWKATLAKLSQKSDVAMAIRYALGRWSALLRFCEDGCVEMDNNAANAARGISQVMPIPGLCRARICQWSRFGRISDSCDCETRHNHRPSRKVSRESVGWKRSGTAPDGAACASALSLSCISAWR